MNDFWARVVCGFILVILLISLPFSDSSIYRKAKDECEKSLPRNQRCKIIAIPDSGDK